MKKLLEFPSLHEGFLIKRYKRFLADIELESGEVITAHCANTGPMKGVLVSGGLVRVRYCPSSSRKLDWSWEQSLVEGERGSPCWVGVNTLLANKLVRLAIEAGFFKEELGEFLEIKPEVTYGINSRSRIDLLVCPIKSLQSKKIYIEIKNTTWAKNSTALFPDTVTKRGQKHLKDLISILPISRSVLIPCISRDDVGVFAPGDEADKEYGVLFREAIEKGMEVIPCAFAFHKDCIKWAGKKSFRNFQSVR